MGEITQILTTPELLKQSSQTMDELLHSALEGYRELGETVRDTEDCFKGKSADRIRKKMEKRKERGLALFEEMMNFPIMLSQIAEEYRSAERDNEDAANRN
ncbi:MAG: hypothetical protein HDR10_02815 [Lachnospiraceae bacterium]|nr:hypothetical protein [Lachnospiraceae bacterium]